jgi:predicted AAA+ superfamily ATPase
MDAYWAKDIQELFRIERRQSFQKFAELVMAQSGGIFTAKNFARRCEVSHTTIGNYLGVLEATFVAHVVRPFSSHRPTEIVAAPKVYAFDTGFVSYHRGWHTLRREDMGLLWEHYVLNELQANLQTREIRYWRDKRGHEVDFIWRARGAPPIAIECKWSADDFDPAAMRAFRVRYPKGQNVVVLPDAGAPFKRRYGEVESTFMGLRGLVKLLALP